MTTDWVCGNCGSASIDPSSIQASVDSRYPIGLCWDCRKGQPLPKAEKDKTPTQVDIKPVKHVLSPLVRAGEFHPKARRPTQAKPESLW